MAFLTRRRQSSCAIKLIAIFTFDTSHRRGSVSGYQPNAPTDAARSCRPMRSIISDQMAPDSRPTSFIASAPAWHKFTCMNFKI